MNTLISHLYTGKSLTLVSIQNNKLETNIIENTHANWGAIVKAYKAKDYDQVIDLINVRRAIATKSSGRFTVEGESVLFNGEPVHGFLFDRIISHLREGLDFDNLLKFADNLWQNPSNRARNYLFQFLADRNFTIDEDGYVLGWKGVRDDYYSVRGSPIRPLKGTVNEHGQIYNGVGEVIQIDRGLINDEYEVACHTGLHVGTRAFARSFASRLMVVRFNPKDAVTVPNSGEKLRVAEYEVVAEEDATPQTVVDDSYNKPLPKRDANGRFCKQ